MKTIPETPDEILKHFGVEDKKLSDFPSVTFKPYYLRSKWKISKELKACLPFLFNGVCR